MIEYECLKFLIQVKLWFNLSWSQQLEACCSVIFTHILNDDSNSIKCRIPENWLNG